MRRPAVLTWVAIIAVAGLERRDGRPVARDREHVVDVQVEHVGDHVNGCGIGHPRAAIPLTDSTWRQARLS